MKTTTGTLALISFILIFFTVSCEKESFQMNLPKATNNSIQTSFSVNQSEAVEVGSNHFKSIKEKNGKLRNLRTDENPFNLFLGKKVKSIKTLKEKDEDLFHIINYEDKGFIIVSADKRTTPILAYSEENSFGGEELEGISDWISSVKTGILKAKKELKEPQKKDEKLWDLYLGKKSKKTLRLNEDCPSCDQTWNFSTTQFVDAIAQWGQNGEYRWYSPTDGGCNCPRKAAGCGPVAMGMIMNYYHHPNMIMTFNGQTLATNYPMPRQINGGSCNFPNNQNDRQVSMLVRLCGESADSGYGVLGNCNTWTYPGKINNALSFMGYANGGTWGSLSNQYSNVKNDLSNGFPVIFTGTLNHVNNRDAHIWVGDGYSSFSYEYPISYYDEYGNFSCYCGVNSVEWISMNWGQYGQSNGFYLANYSFTYCDNNGCDTYDTYLRALTGIRPN